jgi:hypothetical protein
MRWPGPPVGEGGPGVKDTTALGCGATLPSSSFSSTAWE